MFVYSGVKVIIKNDYVNHPKTDVELQDVLFGSKEECKRHLLKIMKKNEHYVDYGVINDIGMFYFNEDKVFDNIKVLTTTTNYRYNIREVPKEYNFYNFWSK
jgi:hypothetical protein